MGYCLRLGLSCGFYMFERTCHGLAKPAHTTREHCESVKEDSGVHRVTVSSRGQIVIPVELRRKLGISPGTHLRLIESGAKVMLVPELEDAVEAGFGFLKKTVSQGAKALEEQS